MDHHEPYVLVHPGGVMSDPLTERLNQILPNITSDDFLRGKGLGNEIAFIFDYPPEAERRIREHIAFLLDHMPKQRPGLGSFTSISSTSSSSTCATGNCSTRRGDAEEEG